MKCNVEILKTALGSDEPTSPELDQHLESCQACQKQLQSLAADNWWWSSGCELVSDSELAVTESVSGGARENEIAEDYSRLLDPSRHPEMMGRLGNFDVERVIGRGGTGIVFKGFDTELNRPIAIKVLSPHLATSGLARQRFAREARASAAIVDENVMAIHAIEPDGKLPYFVMPFVAGDSLQNYVEKRGPLEVKDIFRIAIQIASGLRAAHLQGLIHRDVKPANIMLENGCNRVLIADFGLARAADDVSITRTGLVAGTPRYMSPEQAMAKPVDSRSDLFSLGSTIYFMATGRAPFQGDNVMAVLNQICDSEPRMLREENPDCPFLLEEIVEKLLAKNPAERFQTATELHTILNQCLAHLQQPTSHKPPLLKPKESPAATRLDRLKNQLPNIALACSVIVILVVVAWPFIGNSQVPNETNPIAEQKKESVKIDAESKRIPSVEQIQGQVAEVSDVLTQLETDDPKTEEHDPILSEINLIDRELRILESSFE